MLLRMLVDLYSPCRAQECLRNKRKNTSKHLNSPTMISNDPKRLMHRV